MRLLSARALTFAAVLSAGALLAQSGPNDPRAREIFKELIEINTTDSVGNVTKAAEAVAARLKAAGFADADVRVLGPNPRKGNLVARFRGTGARRPVLLLAHLDVVEARREDWTTDPFTLIEKEGFFYGRGTTDDKAMATSLAANLIRLKQEGFKPDRDLILALTADEEGGSFNGVDWLVRNHRPLIDAAFALNEGGSGQMTHGQYLTNEVEASEKVYQDFRLETKNPGGHGSRPVKDNAIYRLAAGLSRLAAYEFPVELNDVTRTYFDRMAGVQADPKLAADMRAVAPSLRQGYGGSAVALREGGQPAPDPEAAKRLAAASPYYNALMRTTCVATMLQGGHALNALPQTSTANVNCRILPGKAPAAVRQKLTEVLADSGITVTPVDQAKPSPPSPLTPEVMGPIESITRAMWPGVLVVPTMSTGATDGLYLRNAGIPTYGVEGMFNDMDDVRAHGKDERLGVKQFFEGVEFHYRLIKALASS